MSENEESNVHAALQKGINEFNERQFFQCHETLEALWIDYDKPDRECIQGIIQIAVAYYHYRRDNRAGALKLLTRGLLRISRFAPAHFGLDLERLCLAVVADIERLQGASDGDELCLKIPTIGTHP
jgi:predicted metal-dependent hydrolase